MSYSNLKASLSAFVHNRNSAIGDSNNANDYIKSDEFIDIAKGLALGLKIDTNTDEFNNFINDVIDNFQINMDEGESLIDIEDSEHDLDWARKNENSSNNYYSKAYENLLSQNPNMPPNVVRTLMQNSLNILCSLGDPMKAGKWKRKGLIFGHVQSGKTANFLGLISKAADAGYKMIIVLTTSHENLRQQTQRRIDEGFVGYDTDSPSKVPIGVGALDKGYIRPINLTTAAYKGDGAMQKIIGTSIQATDIDKPWVVVTKKNIPLLKRLYAWLEEDAVNDKIKSMPLLLIDDECDYASPNTRKPEDMPTNTNIWIRKLLALYDKSSYVGVTATPFANIFIDHETTDEMLEDDLFPKDLIYNLEAPENYFGAGKVFLDNETSNRIVEYIDDADDFFPTKKGMIPVDGIPGSLKNAFHEFIIAKCIRNLRGDGNEHCTMMINAHTHKYMTEKIFHNMESYYNEVLGAITSNYMMDDNFSMQNPIMSQLHSIYDYTFGKNVKEKWADIKAELNNVMREMKFYAEYSGSPFGSLDYESWSKSGRGLTAVVIGGFKLSRGLTLEGLTVSYLFRDPQVGDTLLQLGRFFGYRPNYGDLVRVHIKESTKRHFSEISESIEKLRMQITQMIDQRTSPEQFGLYMHDNYSDKFKISSPSKLRSAKDKLIRIGYAGEIIYNDHISAVNEDLINNEEQVSNFFHKYETEIQEAVGKDYCKYLKKIDTQSVLDLLSNIKYSMYNKSKFTNLCQYLDEKMKLHPTCDVIFDCTNGSEKVSNFPFEFGFRKRTTWKYNDLGKYWINKSSQLTDKDCIKRIIDSEQQKTLSNRFPNKEMSNRLYQTVMERPVLLIAPIFASNNEINKAHRMYGTELYYPSHMGRHETIKVKVNTVYEDQYEFMYWPSEDDE